VLLQKSINRGIFRIEEASNKGQNFVFKIKKKKLARMLNGGSVFNIGKREYD
jgi:hypothetical protein